SVLLGTGTGTFQPQLTLPAGVSPVWVTVADVNHDRFPDLAVVNRGDRTVSVLLGDGRGGFQPQQTFATGIQPASLTATDVDGGPRSARVGPGFRRREPLAPAPAALCA